MRRPKVDRSFPLRDYGLACQPDQRINTMNGGNPAFTQAHITLLRSPGHSEGVQRLRNLMLDLEGRGWTGAVKREGPRPWRASG